MILLKKADQINYIFPSVYKPIFLFFTLKKAIKSAIATCINYLTNNYFFFQNNYFNCLKKRSIVDALPTLQEKVYQV